MIENLDEFKKLYSEFYAMLPESFTDPIYPFFMQIGKGYHASKPKCLFVGKATNGWGEWEGEPSRNVDVLFDREHPNRIANRDDEIMWVENLAGNKAGYNTTRSAFWRVIKETTKHFFPNSDWHAHIAWSNIYKFSPNHGNPDACLQKAQRAICNRILDKEIEYLTPDVVIFLTSGWEWFYMEHRGFKAKGEKLYYQTKDKITYIHSQHPQGKKEQPHISALIEIIKGL